MNMPILLPRILGFRLKGFEPIFKGDVTMTLGSGPNVILGGNGLGKTTIMQAVVYGLAGAFDSDELEEVKALRWNHGYFRGRLNPSQIAQALIEIDFSLGDNVFSVRRSFRGSEVVAFRFGTNVWIDNPQQAGESIEHALREFGGYRNVYDFTFLVHRLLYLPESRRLIAWDVDAQTRILMLLNQDATIEEKFRERRAQLTELDSNKRRIHWYVGKAEKRIERMKATSSSSDKKKEKTDSDTLLIPSPDLVGLVNRLQRIARQRLGLQQSNRLAADNLSKASTEIEELRERIEQSEASLVISFLQKEEREKDLAVHKLLENGICPVCGTQQPELQNIALQNSLTHHCVLCGSDEPHETNPELSQIRGQLAQKIGLQQMLEGSCRAISNQLEVVMREEEQLQIEVNKARFEQPILTLTESDLADFDDMTNPVEQKKSLEIQEADLAAQIYQMRTKLETDYREFLNSINERIQKLRELYEKYATEFLGIKCELVENPHKELMELSRFIPKFNGIERETPDSCSEAQRFFLDIAFRMALIDLAATMANQKATFICETPETALDLSYVKNVVRMFDKFISNGNSLLLSANIQPGGIAEKLLKLIPAEERAAHFINLLDIGQLSAVHLGSLSELRSAVAQAMDVY
jgi:hypothetical protein